MIDSILDCRYFSCRVLFFCCATVSRKHNGSTHCACPKRDLFGTVLPMASVDSFAHSLGARDCDSGCGHTTMKARLCNFECVHSSLFPSCVGGYPLVLS